MPGRVLYASFATQHLSGGVEVHLRHIALLRAAGVEASLWLPEPAVPAWMGAVPVVSGASIEVGADDVVLYPEAPVLPGVDPAPGARKVVFNQNHFYTYATWAAPASTYPGWDPAPVGLVGVARVGGRDLGPAPGPRGAPGAAAGGP